VRVAAILTAAGSGSRLGASGPKALVALAGVPLVVRAARALLASGQVEHLVVTAPADQVAVMEHVLSSATPPVIAEVVAGGATRQASVAAGIARIVAWADGATETDGPGDETRSVVLVHDAARPLVPEAVVRRVISAVEAGHDAVIPGLAVTDTVKQVEQGVARSITGAEADGRAPLGGPALVDILRVVATPDRSTLRAVQTPQGFALDLLRRAHEAGASRAADEASAATDDAALVEALGIDVWVVAGHEDALKVTTPRDLALAEILLAGS